MTDNLTPDQQLTVAVIALLGKSTQQQIQAAMDDWTINFGPANKLTTAIAMWCAKLALTNQGRTNA